MTGAEVASAEAVQVTTSTNVVTGAWAVDLTFSPDGTKDFAELMSNAFTAGTQIAFVVDGTSYSEATVMEGSLTGGQAELTGTISRQTAEHIAAAVNAGPLPGDFRLVGESTTP